MKTINQIKDLKGKKVFLRADFNVPIKAGKVEDENRILESLPTIKYLMSKKARVVIGAHLGQPEGKKSAESSLVPVAKCLSRLLKSKVPISTEVLGNKTEKMISELENGQVMMLENLRWRIEEEKGDIVFAKNLAKLFELYVNDAFASAHRPHVSVFVIASYLPHYAGFLMQKEVENLSKIIKNQKKPFIIIIGGAKIADKIGVIENLAPKVDKFLIGGAMGNTFLASLGNEMSFSLYEADALEIAREYLAKYREKIMLPVDNIKKEIDGGFSYVDIGVATIRNYRAIIKNAKTIFWNGNLGYSEEKESAVGTIEIAKEIAKNRSAFSVVAGGDTVAAIRKLNLQGTYSFVSTGGGASLEFLAGKKLPGIEALD